jgi:hypothetical protein
MLKYGGAIVSPPIDPFIGQHPRPSISEQPAEIDLAVYSWRSARVHEVNGPKHLYDDRVASSGGGAVPAFRHEIELGF